jgi:hypothetical protein
LIDKSFRNGPNSRGIQVGDAVLLRQKFLDEVAATRAEAVATESWAWTAGIVIDSMEDHAGFLQFEVMFEHEIGWWDDYELKLVEENKTKGE